MSNSFDVIVIGAGHAGLEAAFISAKFNLKVGLFSLNIEGVANLPCNPSLGGPAKGVVVREIDALGGIQGIAADANKIQIKTVNFSKGPGVWAFRAQIDKETYHTWFLDKINQNPNITLIIDEVCSLIKKEDKIIGIKTKAQDFFSKTVIITTGTYLRSELFHNVKFAESGPDKFPRSNFLSNFFIENDIEIFRLKTGTSPRVYKDSIDFSKLEKDDSNDENISFSFISPKNLPLEDQMYCYLSYTTKQTKEFIAKNQQEFGLFNGNINAVGPRYCPSIEDKFARFKDRDFHYVFVEPVGRNLDFYYLSGLSTSLNKDLQLEFLQTLTGFENAKIKTFAYSIVYDAINPMQLDKTLELKKIKNLYFAGQVNGTSGYEEAAAQGLMAGINASLKVLNKEPLILKRNEAYIGVLIDDLTSKGTKEPYRLLTSRAEFRLILRNDNADERLMSIGYKLGTITKEKYDIFYTESQNIAFNLDFLKNNYASKFGLIPGSEGPVTLFSYLCRADANKELLFEKIKTHLKPLTQDSLHKLLIQVKYDGYIKLQDSKINNIDKWKKISLLNIDDYSKIHNLSSEAIQKLNARKPITIYDALQISGININDVYWVKFFLDNRNKKSNLNQ